MSCSLSAPMLKLMTGRPSGIHDGSTAAVRRGARHAARNRLGRNVRFGSEAALAAWPLTARG